MKPFGCACVYVCPENFGKASQGVSHGKFVSYLHYRGAEQNNITRLLVSGVPSTN